MNNNSSLKLDWKTLAIAGLIAGASGGGTYLGTATGEDRIRAIVESSPPIVEIRSSLETRQPIFDALVAKVDTLASRMDRLICEFQIQRGEHCDLTP